MLPFQIIRSENTLFLVLSVGSFIISAEAVIAFLGQRSVTVALGRRYIFIGIFQQQIIVDKLFKKAKRTRSVGNNMICFKINGIFIIAYPKKQVSELGKIYLRTYRKLFLLNNGAKGAVFKIIPEKSLSHDRAEPGKGFQRCLGSLLQKLPVHIFVQLAVKSENTGIGAFAGGGENFGGIVQPAP